MADYQGAGRTDPPARQHATMLCGPQRPQNIARYLLRNSSTQFVNEADEFSFYKEHPKNCAADDFWGQVMRTVNGKPISETQIGWIVDAIVAGLELRPEDLLLDFCCGNGALTDRIFRQCQGGLGVDFSPALIEVAHRYFQTLPDRAYVLADAAEFANRKVESAAFTKALCYGSFMFLPETKAAAMLSGIHRHMSSVRKIFLGNLPDRDRLSDFYHTGEYRSGIERDPTSAIGIWRTKAELGELAATAGWNAEFSQMRPEFFAAHYRYDVVLSRNDR